MSVDASPPLCTGRPVRLHSLSRSELNGLEGFVQRYDEASGRWGVQLLSGGAALAIRPVNLAPVHASSAGAVSLPSAGSEPAAAMQSGWHLAAPQPAVSGSHPTVSLLVPTHRRPWLLSHALGMIAKQDYPRDKLEVVIIEDGPCSLADIASSVGFRDLFAQTIYLHLGDERRPIGVKRNTGLQLCSGHIVMHWDDDDFYGASRISMQVAPIVAGKASVTLISLAYWYSAEETQFYRVKDNMGGHLSTLCYDRSLWSSTNPILQYGCTFHGEDLFFFRNILELPQVVKIDLPQDIVAHVYVKHRASMSGDGPPAEKCNPPEFLPDTSRAFLLSLKEQILNPGMRQTIVAQAKQEESFLETYFGCDDLVHLPRRYLMNMTETVQRIPEGSSDRETAAASIARALSGRCDRLLPQSLVLVAWACSTMGVPRENTLYAAVSAEARLRLEQDSAGTFTAHDVALLTWIFGRRGICDRELFAFLMPSALALLDGFGPLDLANLTTGLARLGLGQQYEAILKAILTRAEQITTSFSTEEWQRLGWAFNCLGTPGTLSAFAPRFTAVPAKIAVAAHSRLEMLRSTQGLPCLQPLCEKPPILVVTGFVSPEEAKQLMDLSMPMWERVPADTLVVELRGPTQAGHPLVLDLQHRAEILFGLPKGHAEPVRISRHRPKDPSRPFSDAVTEADVKEALSLPSPEPRHPKWAALRGGQRIATILVYLSERGRQQFGDLDLDAAPPRGAALIWPVVQPNGRAEPKWASCEGEASAGGCAVWLSLRAEVAPKLGPPRSSLCGA